MNGCEAIQPAFDALLLAVDQVFAVDKVVVNSAKQFVLGYAELSAGDAIQGAVLQENGVTEILIFDSGFDGVARSYSPHMRWSTCISSSGA